MWRRLTKNTCPSSLFLVNLTRPGSTKTCADNVFARVISSGHEIRKQLDTICKELGVQYHGVRFRTTGYRQMIEVHLLFPHKTEVGEAHGLATQLEERLSADLGVPAEVTTHLESLEDHSEVHRVLHYIGRPD